MVQAEEEQKLFLINLLGRRRIREEQSDEGV